MLKHYLLTHFEELDELVTAINAYNGELEHLMVYENDEEFFETFFNNKPMEAVRAAQYGDYKFNHEYVTFDGYGNLQSYSWFDYNTRLKDRIDEIIYEYRKIKDVCNWLNPELKEILEGAE